MSPHTSKIYKTEFWDEIQTANDIHSSYRVKSKKPQSYVVCNTYKNTNFNDLDFLPLALLISFWRPFYSLLDLVESGFTLS